MTIDLGYIKALVGLVSDNDLTELKLGTGENKIIIKKEKATQNISFQQQNVTDPGVISAQTAAQQDSSQIETQPAKEDPQKIAAVKGIPITSPMVGTFYSAPSPDSPSFVKVGDKITVGQTLCIIESMKLMNEIESEVAGTVIEVCITDAEPVDAGTVLMYIE